MADRLYTSSEADEILSALRFETKLEKATLARMAFALSLSRVGSEVPGSPSFSGGEMKRPTFFAEDETFIRTMLSFVYKRPDISEDELFSNRSLTKNHIDHGALLLNELFSLPALPICASPSTPWRYWLPSVWTWIRCPATCSVSATGNGIRSRSFTGTATVSA